MIYAFDLDGTLTKFEVYRSFTDIVFFAAKPRHKIIEKLRHLKKRGHTIVIHTARPCIFLNVTKKWLRKFKVPYDHIVMSKFYADVYVDDKGIRPEELK